MLGNIEIKPMQLSIKSLDTGYEFKEAVKLEQWAKVIGYMQSKGIEDHENPK